MAKYWAQYSNGEFSDEADSISKIEGRRSGRIFYAEGDDIDIDFFFSIGHQNPIDYIIYDSNFAQVLLQNSGNRTGYSDRIGFENCKIENFKLINLTFPSLSFNNCEITDIEIVDSKSVGKLEFKVKNKVKNIKIQNCEDFKELKFNGENEVENLIIKDCVLSQFEVTDAILINNSQMTKSNILEIRIKNSIIGKFEFNDNKSLQHLSFKNIVFNKISFNENNIGHILSIDKCTGDKLEFNLCEFVLKNFHLTNCSIKLDLYKVQAHEKIKFRINQSQESKIYIRRCYFSDEVLFLGEFANIEKNFIITDTVFRDLVLFDDDNAKCLVINESLFQKGLMLPIPKIERITEIDSSVWCILKNQALSRNENINAIEYRKNELTSYTNELKLNGTHFQEWLVLLFNKISNNHGINWFRGILFTMVTWLLFYSIFVMSKENFYGLFHTGSTFLLTDSHFWSDAIGFLWLPQGVSDLSTGLKEHHSGIVAVIMAISFVLGKIFIAYGVFQTISAFRRHGKA